MIKVYTADNFQNNEAVQHGFFTRLGGQSSGVYHGLNCGAGSDDQGEIVRNNLGVVAHHIGIESDQVVSPYQVHGAECYLIEDVPQERLKGDALVTRKKGLALSVVTADCAPVLFYGEDCDGLPVIGAAHAGSKGALSGVLDNVVGTMVQAGALIDGIKACVGPCISKASYEVGFDFVENFIKSDETCERFFHPGAKDERAQFDLSGYCAWRLYRAGVQNVSLLDIDTYTNEKEFFSYRRSVHKGDPDYGRQISIIAIKS
ncbi:MAG: polyphenol oxidase family protein [Alphaproteobacteria bacterium]